MAAGDLTVTAFVHPATTAITASTIKTFVEQLLTLPATTDAVFFFEIKGQLVCAKVVRATV